MVAYDKLKVGTKVWDRWYVDWGDGKVVKIRKASVDIEFPMMGSIRRPQIIKFDLAHLQFLELSDVVK